MKSKAETACVALSLNSHTANLKTLESICSKIYPAKLNQIQNLSDSKKKISLSAFLMAIFFIKNRFEISNLIFSKINGKPFLKNENNAFFNISHTKTAIACATSTCPVGVDLENTKLINLNLAKKICCKNELKFFSSLPDEFSKMNYLIKIWTAKESFVKMNAKTIFQNLTLINSEQIANLKTFKIKNLFLSVCTKSKRLVKLHKIDFNKIIDFFNMN